MKIHPPDAIAEHEETTRNLAVENSEPTKTFIVSQTSLELVSK
jgi:hypothetical protein